MNEDTLGAGSIFNTTWGDGFSKGVSYLIVSPQNIGGLTWTPLCGHTIDLDYADKIGSLTMLKRLLGRQR